MTIDPRIAQRRAAVAEVHAKLNLRRLLWLALAAATVGGMIWLVTSPVMSVQTIETYGVVNSDVNAILRAEQVTAGRPLIVIRSGRVADRLEQDPWVAEAGVELIFPDRVEVTVIERESAAWINVGSKWAHVSSDGVALEYAPAPPPEVPVVRLTAPDPGLGELLTDPVALGAVRFVAALPESLRAGATVREDDGELWASVAGRTVRLGTAADMAAKAVAAAAVLEYEGTDGVGVIDVIAPSRPAIWSSADPAAETDVAEEEPSS